MRVIGFSRGRYYVYIDREPLVGHIAFGVIDRGTNVLQIRPTTICPYSCIYCSVDAGPFSRHRQTEYIVDVRHLVKWVRYVYDYKGGDVVEGLIDGVGEPPTYPYIVELVSSLKKFLPRVAMETRGGTLTKELVDALARAGLDRFNVSIDTLRKEKAVYLQNTPWYNVERVREVVEYIVRETDIDVTLTPVWIPGINDEDIEEVVEWGLRIGVGKRFPPFGIQKYEVHKYGRKIPGVREPTWSEFRDFLEVLENRYGVPLHYKKLDFGIRKTKAVEPIYRVGERVVARVVGSGWLWREVLGVDYRENVNITIVDIDFSPSLIGKRIDVRIIRNRDSIYVARKE
ncbi:Radical SAM domain protein [Ignisphaera aggregans DSM 17230]|uniref:Radical SAM domain protein n=1 Tax=Ignisphaera aggregans (strain DSM 17230 / JCM 13409 / AQ1.S1) TaxID=583356 RepID=E0SPR0_IGNAA|nr:Radical SAM domain protein [Ignisphaera aggregans DSM 17230]